LYVFFSVFPRRQIQFCRRFGTLCQVHLQRLDEEYINLTPGKYPKENIQDSEHGENLKSRKLDEEKNQCITEKTGTQNIAKEIKQYQKKWLQHVGQTQTEYQKQALRYRPTRRRNIGRPRKRWRDQIHLED
jgi:hypothetical protein